MGLFTKKARKAGPASPPVAADHAGPSSAAALYTTPSPPYHPLQPWQSQTGVASHYAESQPAGHLPPPPPPPSAAAWSPAGHAPAPYHQPYPPLVVNQHYYLMPPPAPVSQCASPGSGAFSKLNLGSVVNLANEILPGSVPQLFDDGLPAWHGHSSQLLNQGAALVDQIAERFNDVMTLIDGERYAGDEKALFTFQPPPAAALPAQGASPALAGGEKAGVPAKAKKGGTKGHPKGQSSAAAATVISGGYFAKVELYANSRLPMHLPPLKLYISTYPLLSLAAHYSERVYEKPRGAERDTHVDADFRTGTKAMVLKSVPMDDMNTIVFAIRGTATFMDWAVNLNMAPTSPAGFLDDPGNFCHAGFLSVARKMVKPVAARLRQLLEDDPSRGAHSLLITGHSAGGAVAALLFSHMLAASGAAASELNALAGRFRRVHCVTFGAPPVSLLPLQKPDRGPRLRKFLFLGFVNEGDPVARADPAYVRSLLELLATPAPAAPATAPATKKAHKGKKPKGPAAAAAPRPGKAPPPPPARPVWKVPPGTLSSAGRVVVLRSGDPGAGLRGGKTVEERLNEGVVAQVATDEQLRGVVWGDPVCHVMRLYAGRLQTLAVAAVTAQGR